jgi:hypothetical protein
MTIKQYTRNIRASTTLALWVCIIVAVGLFIASFLVPPMGVIDGSVLRAASLLFAFGALATVREAVREGLGAKLTHGNTVLEIRDKEGRPRPPQAPEQEPVEKEEEETK